MLTHERLKELLTYDPETGIFTHNTTKARRVKGKPAGCVVKGYVVISIDTQIYRAHRLAWLYMTGKWPAHTVDHRDTDKSNNKWSNLREATGLEQMQNLPLMVTNTSGYPGVSYNKQTGRFTAKISVNNKRHHLGYFDTPEEAFEAYQKAKSQLHMFNPVV